MSKRMTEISKAFLMRRNYNYTDSCVVDIKGVTYYIHKGKVIASKKGGFVHIKLDEESRTSLRRVQEILKITNWLELRQEGYKYYIYSSYGMKFHVGTDLYLDLTNYKIMSKFDFPEEAMI